MVVSLRKTGITNWNYIFNHWSGSKVKLFDMSSRLAAEVKPKVKNEQGSKSHLDTKNKNSSL